MQFYSDVKFSYEGKPITYKDGEYSDVPERCPECNCCIGEPNWKPYTNQTIHICEQCATELYVEY